MEFALKKNVKLPSDLSGFTTIEIESDTDTLKNDIKKWLNNVSRETAISVCARKDLETHKTLYERWNYAKEITIVNYAASSFLIPTIASDSVYNMNNKAIFEEKIQQGTKFRFVIVRPNSYAARDAANNKMKIMANSDISPNDIFAKSVSVLKGLKEVYGNCIQFKLTKIALTYAAIWVVNDDEHRFMNHIKIDLYAPYILDSNRRSFIVNYGDENYNFFMENITDIWEHNG
ncbi:MAG: hypothetical protein IJ682_04345 [Lachnospiraceae bacterium]|nr:hypothetical protein [Lachnospiraceae bacterium]